MDGDGYSSQEQSFVHSLPSDYSEMQGNSYDPDYISDISNKMQVPDRISVGGSRGPMQNGFDPTAAHMTVPDRIIVAGDNKHIGMKEGLRQLDFERLPDSDGMSYVGLITPPRTLTLEERFPTVEENEVHKNEQHVVVKAETNGPNGSVTAPVPYTPGVSPYDSLLLNEEDEATLLRTQMAKLTRRLAVMEQDNQRRSQRELFLYPAVFGYLLFRVFFWFMRNR